MEYLILFFITFCLFLFVFIKLKSINKKILDSQIENKEVYSKINQRMASKNELKSEVDSLKSHIDNGLLTISKRIGKSKNPKN